MTFGQDQRQLSKKNIINKQTIKKNAKKLGVFAVNHEIVRVVEN